MLQSIFKFTKLEIVAIERPLTFQCPFEKKLYKDNLISAIKFK